MYTLTDTDTDKDIDTDKDTDTDTREFVYVRIYICKYVCVRERVQTWPHVPAAHARGKSGNAGKVCVFGEVCVVKCVCESTYCTNTADCK